MKGGVKVIKLSIILINHFKSQRNQIAKDFLNILNKVLKAKNKQVDLFFLFKFAMLQNLA